MSTKAELFPGESILRFIHQSQHRKLIASWQHYNQSEAVPNIPGKREHDYRRRFTDVFSPDFSWGRGDVCTQAKNHFPRSNLFAGCVDGSAAKNFPRTRTSWPARKRTLGWLNSTHYNITIFYTIFAQQRFLWPLLNSTSRFQSTVKSILGFIIPLHMYSQDFCYNSM